MPDFGPSLKGDPYLRALWGMSGGRLFGGFACEWATRADAQAQVTRTLWRFRRSELFVIFAKYEENLIRVSRQHLPESDGGVHPKGAGEGPRVGE